MCTLGFFVASPRDVDVDDDGGGRGKKFTFLAVSAPPLFRDFFHVKTLNTATKVANVYLFEIKGRVRKSETFY